MVVIDSAILVFTAAVLFLVVATKAVRGTIRFVLANILIASITACAGISMICLRATVAISSHLFTHEEISYKIFLATMAIGGNGRSAFMAIFAVVVVIIIKCSNSAIKFKYLVASVVVVWIASVTVGAILVVPGVVELHPRSCLADVIFLSGNENWIFGASYFLFFAVFPFTLAIFMPVYALCYIRSNLVSENASSLKPMVKFAFFLLLGNGLCFFGNAFATAGGLITKSTNVGDKVLLDLMRMYHVVLVLSLIPTPILIIVYFKPVRIQMRQCVLWVCGKCCKRHLRRSKQDSLTEMMLASPADNDII